MPYSPNNPNYLTVAQSMTSDGEKNVKVILDISTNTFYTLDDNDNFLPIQNNEWTEVVVPISAAQILALGTVPVELLPAPGADKYYEWEGYLEMTAGNVAFDFLNTDLLYISESNYQGTTFDYTSTNSLSNKVAYFSSKMPTYLGGMLTTNATIMPMQSINSAVTIGTWLAPSGTSPTVGNGTFNVILRYKINTLR